MTAAPLIALTLALAPAVTPTPDPAPQARHRHRKVTILPACPRINGLPAGYVVELQGKTVVCAGWWR